MSYFANNSSIEFPVLLSAVLSVIDGTTIFLCIFASVLVFVLRLYKTVVYRLALYQVLSALLLTILHVVQFVQAYTYFSGGLHIANYATFCVALGWLTLYARWMKILFTMWVSLHIFCFVAFQKNLKKLEVLYVITSLFVPMVIAIVPLITDGYTKAGVCYIIRTVELVVLWDVPAMAALLVASVVMVVIVVKLAWVMHKRRTIKYELYAHDSQYWEALKQLLPLAAFTIFFLVLMIPVVVFDTYILQYYPKSWELNAFIAVIVPTWNLSAGATLLIHICVTQHFSRRRKKRAAAAAARDHVAVKTADDNLENISYNQSSASVADSVTRFSLPEPSSSTA